MDWTNLFATRTDYNNIISTALDQGDGPYNHDLHLTLLQSKNAAYHFQARTFQVIIIVLADTDFV